jgi:putative transcriptional regulator
MPYKRMIAKKLMMLRAQKRKSRSEVAHDLSISLSTLQMYENGQRVPRDDLKVRIAQYYGVTVQELFFEH